MALKETLSNIAEIIYILCGLVSISTGIRGLKNEKAQKLLEFYKNYEKEKSGNALASYTGVAYKAIKIETFDKNDFEYLESHLVILSALYGVLTPYTNVKEYRLDMTNSIFESKSLYEVWKTSVNGYFEKEDVVLNLASKEYSKLINFDKLIDFEFWEDSNFVIVRTTDIWEITEKVYKIENNFLNKTIYIKSEGINESYTFNTNNKTFTLEIQENGKKDIFIDLYDSFAEARIIINNTESIKKIFLLPSLSERGVELKSKSTDLFLLKKIVIFDEILDKSRKDRILDNLLYLPKIENKTKNLPYSIVTNDINGSPILKLSNNTLVINDKGLKVNSSEDLLMPININDDEKLLSIKGAKLLLTNFTSIVTNFNNDKANKIHRHNFSDLDNVPYANSDNQGLVILSNDINENASNKAATPFFVNSINRKINTRINEIENIGIKNNTDKIGNIINTIIPKINENIQKVNENLIKSVRELNNTISAPTSYLDKRVGGVVNADVTIRNINFGNNIMRFNKDSNSHTFMFFNRGFINHGPGGQGIETFKFAPSTYSNQTTGGIEIGYANGTNFNRTSYISSSGYAVFTGANITGDMIVGRNITLYGDLVVTSDRRLKSDIKKVENGIDKIKKLSGYTFKKIDTGLYSAGVIAQEVQKVMPELIIEEDNKLKVNYNGIHSLEIEAIKELSKQIEELKEEINSLKRR